jgi:hypothetical protein
MVRRRPETKKARLCLAFPWNTAHPNGRTRHSSGFIEHLIGNGIHFRSDAKELAVHRCQYIRGHREG